MIDPANNPFHVLLNEKIKTESSFLPDILKASKKPEIVFWKLYRFQNESFRVKLYDLFWNDVLVFNHLWIGM